jgi:hypothetical protein
LSEKPDFWLGPDRTAQRTPSGPAAVDPDIGGPPIDAPGEGAVIERVAERSDAAHAGAASRSAPMSKSGMHRRTLQRILVKRALIVWSGEERSARRVDATRLTVWWAK